MRNTLFSFYNMASFDCSVVLMQFAAQCCDRFAEQLRSAIMHVVLFFDREENEARAMHLQRRSPH